MKTKEELNALKNEVKALNEKLAELSEDELKEVVGGGSCLGEKIEGSKGGISIEDWNYHEYEITL